MSSRRVDLPALVPAAPVPLADGRIVTYANLDGAASTSALQVVADRVAEVLPYYASVHRGAGWMSQVATTLYESSRRTIAMFVDARPDDVAIVTRNTTDALNLLADALPDAEDGTPGRVLVLDVEHHANLLPWINNRGSATVLEAEKSIAATLAALERELDVWPYVLVAVTGASNVTGERLPLDEVTRIAHAAGARVSVDGAQLIAHRRFSMAATDVDYLAFSGHKTYAPYGSGVLVGRRDWLDEAPAHLSGGGAVTRVSATEIGWATSPARHEGGTPNLLGAVALATACEALAAVPEATLTNHERSLLALLRHGLAALPGIDLLRIWDDSEDPVGVVTFVVAGQDAGLLAAYLAAEHGVGVRDGLFCAHPLLQRLGYPRGAIRASVGIGSTVSDVTRFLEGVEQFLARGPDHEYAVEDGCWVVVDDQRPVPSVAHAVSLVPTAACGGL